MKSASNRLVQRCLGQLSGEITRLTDDVSIYLCGSAAMGDFSLGLSDIDVLCLTARPVSDAAAENLVMLRQRLRETCDQPLFRRFEGGILWGEAFVSGAETTVVYWGTSGQRVTDRYHFNCFSTLEWLRYGQLLQGPDWRSRVPEPSRDELRQGAAQQLALVRRYAAQTDADIVSISWLFDISRCLYTLETGDIATKTQAGEWALAGGLCPCPEALTRALDVRKRPASWVPDAHCLSWCAALGPHIQRFADVLESQL